jgi:hypothetical protein
MLRHPGEFPAQDFVLIADVPIFAEHETKGRNGRELKFGPEQLQAVADRCNRRISETGDYAAVTLGHTPEPGEGEQPQVVGFAGPFKMGRLAGNKACILTDLHIFRGDEEMLRRYPRRSPELWLEESYDEMFLDPIALLGAEAPRLDMGLLYSAQRNGRQIEKYAAVAPAAGNCFIPGGSSDDEKPKKYAAGAGPMAELSPEGLQQVIEALDNLDWVKAIKGQLNSNQGNNATVPMPQPMQQPPGLPGDPNAAGPTGPPSDMNPAEGPDGSGAPPDIDLDPDADSQEKDAMPDDDRTKLEDDVIADEEPEVLPQDEPAEDAIPAEDDEDDDEKKDKAKYAKTLDALRQTIAILQDENAELRAVVDAETEKRVNAERYQKLDALRKTRAFDIDKEAQKCKYSRKGGMDDKAFADHLECITENYHRIPVGEVDLPTHGAGAQDPMYREKYSKETSDKAFKICEEKRLKGEPVDYVTVLESLTNS